MQTLRTAPAVAIALAIAFAAAGCSTPTDRETPTARPTPGSSASTSPQTPEPTTSGTPTPAATTAAPVEWAPADLTRLCTDFQAGWAEDEGYAAGDFDWEPLATTQQNGATWYVFLQGTFTTPDEDTVPAEFSCAVTGTPDAPVVTETASE